MLISFSFAPVAALGESSPRLLREHAVGDEGRDALRTELLENLAALVQGAAGLHEIVDDDHALTRGVAVLNIHDSLVAIPHLTREPPVARPLESSTLVDYQGQDSASPFRT